MIIRKVAEDQIFQLQDIAKQTFAETFSAANSEENLNKYLKDGFTIEKLRSELNNINSEFYFVIENDKILGYLKLNFGEAQTELKDDKGLEIERIYVLQQYLGKKVGQLLYQKALEIAQNKQVGYIWLGVWEENQRAKNFYKKNGFIEFDKHVFKFGNEDQTDIMMKLQLT